MSEDRRVAPVPKPLDSSASASEVGPASSTAEIAPASDGDNGSGSGPARAPRDSSPGARRRGRGGLRIPDDEVSRPQPAASAPPPPAASAPPPPVAAPAPPLATVPAPPPVAAPAPAPAPNEGGVLRPMRIITINPEATSSAAAKVEVPPAPARPRLDSEDSWTPYQPLVADAAKGPPAPAPAPAPTTAKAPVAAKAPATTTTADPAPAPDAEPTRRQLPSEDMIPIDSDPPPASDPPPESIEPIPETDSDPPPARATAPTEPEGEEVSFDDDAPTPAAPPVITAMSSPAGPSSERRSDPGAEIEAEDVVDVEARLPPKPPASLPPMRPRLKSKPSTPPAAPAAKPAPLPPKPPLVIVPPHVGTVALQPAEASGLRRKGRLWWEELFNDDYLRTCEKLTDEQIAREVDFIEDSLGIERGGAVLDLACGTGRHAIELARRGYEVVGFDLSLAMLARAGDEAQERDAKLNFLQGDMREMTFEEQFDGVYCWNTSFGYFEEDKNALVIDRIHRALKTGGLLLLDVVNRDFLIRQSPSLAWFEGDGCVCMDEMSVDFITSRMRVKRTMMLDDGRSREIEYSMRVYGLHELGKILHDHGFKVCEVSGRIGTPGVFFGNESPRTIILAEKRDKK